MSPGRVSLSAFYHGSWFVLLSLVIALSFASQLMPAGLIVFAGALCLWALVPPWRLRFPPPPWFRAVSALVLTVTGVFVALQAKDPVTGIGAALWSALFFLVPRKQKTFGHWLGLLTASLLALVCAIIKQDFGSHVLFIVYLLGLVLTLNANNLFSLAGPSGSLRYYLNRGYFRQMLPSLLLGLLGGGLVFFFFPRTQGFANPFGLRERESSTGYTGKVTLEGSNNIQEDSAIALTVEARDPKWLAANAGRLYFRGNTLSFFDGRGWSSPETVKWYYRTGGDTRYTSGRIRERVMLRIYREAHSAPAVLYPQVLLSLTAPENLVGPVQMDPSRNLTRTNPGIMRYAYDLIIADPTDLAEAMDVPVADLRRLIAREIARERREGDPRTRVPIGKSYLQIPPSVAGKAYFEKWRAEVPVGDRATLGELVRAVNLNFTRRFKATYIHEKAASGPLSSFLSNERTGHCEYFATVAVLFLRSHGIPARMVLGYRGGTFNDVSRALEVKELNAHAWVELYAGDGRWLRWDPTPVVPRFDVGLKAELQLYFNALKFWFNRYVVHYNMSAQREVFSAVSLWRNRSFRPQPRWQLYLNAFGTAALLVGLLWALRWWRRRRPGHKPHWLPGYYRRFLKRLESRGWRLSPGETLKAFHERIEAGGLDGTLVRRFDEAVHRDLYSPRPLPDPERQRLEAEAREVSPPLRESGGRRRTNP